MKSVVPKVRQTFLRKQCELVKNLTGAVAEVGVYKGGSAKILAESLPDKHIHLFDTFSGMPRHSKFDTHKEGDFSDTSLEAVLDYLQSYNNLSIWPGFFPETTALLKQTHFCLIHVDVDLYESTKDACEFFWPRLVKGGIMVFDDYNSPTCPGANKAVDEFFDCWQAIETSGPNKRYGTRVVKREKG